MEISAANGNRLLDLASAEIRQRLGAGPRPGSLEAAAVAGTAGLPPDPQLDQPAGCFASLHNRFNHALRGCVGRLDATLPVRIAVRESAAACLDDPRFVTRRVTLHELPRLELELSVLGPLVERGSPLEFEPLVHGIYLTIGARAGCFLPQVARETGWTREQLLDRLCTEKLGVHAQAWRGPDARLATFDTIVLGPRGM